MQNDNGGLTYIGPRAFAIAFGIVCVIFLAIILVLDHVSSSFEVPTSTPPDTLGSIASPVIAAPNRSMAPTVTPPVVTVPPATAAPATLAPRSTSVTVAPLSPSPTVAPVSTSVSVVPRSLSAAQRSVSIARLPAAAISPRPKASIEQGKSLKAQSRPIVARHLNTRTRVVPAQSRVANAPVRATFKKRPFSKTAMKTVVERPVRLANDVPPTRQATLKVHTNRVIGAAQSKPQRPVEQAASERALLVPFRPASAPVGNSLSPTAATRGTLIVPVTAKPLSPPASTLSTRP